MSNATRVAVAQYDVPLSPEASIAKLDEITKRAAHEQVALLIAPETAIGSLTKVKQTSENYLPELQRIAEQHRKQYI